MTDGGARGADHQDDWAQTVLARFLVGEYLHDPRDPFPPLRRAPGGSPDQAVRAPGGRAGAEEHPTWAPRRARATVGTAPEGRTGPPPDLFRPRSAAATTGGGRGGTTAPPPPPPDLQEEPPGEGGPASRLARGLGFAGASFAVNVVLALASAVITSRLYGAVVIGQYVIACIPWLTLIQVSNVSEQIALMRSMSTMRPRTEESTGLWFATLTFSAGLTTAMGTIIYLISWLIASKSGNSAVVIPALVILVGYVLLDNTSWNIDTALSAFGAARELFICRLVYAGSFLTFAIAMDTVSDTLWGLTIATVASFAVGLTARVVVARRYLHARPTRTAYRNGLRTLPQLLRYGVQLVPAQIFGGLTPQVGIWVVSGSALSWSGGSRDAADALVGSYGRAANLAIRINDAAYRVHEILFPALVQRHAEGDTHGFARTVARTVRITAFPLLLIAGVGAGVATSVMKVFGPAFEQAAGALGFLLFAHVGYVIATIQGTSLNAADRTLLSSLLTCLRLVVSAAMMVLLAPRWEVTGVAAALAVGYYTEVMVRAFVLDRAVLRHSADRIGPRPILAMAGAAAVAYVASRSIDEALPTGLGLLVGGAVGTLLYLAVAVAGGAVTYDERNQMAAQVTRRLRARRERGYA